MKKQFLFKFSSISSDADPTWNKTFVILFNDTIDDSTLHIDIVHADAKAGVKPLVGLARLPLRDVVDESGLGGDQLHRKLHLKRPSSRPQGKINVDVAVRQLRYLAEEPSNAAPYAIGSSGYGAPPPPYGNSYRAAPPPPAAAYGSIPYSQPAGYGHAYGQPVGYNQPVCYGQSYGQRPTVEQGKKEKKGVGLGTGLAVGAVAGVLGGLALAEGIDYAEEKIAEDAADKVEEDVGCYGYDDSLKG